MKITNVLLTTALVMAASAVAWGQGTVVTQTTVTTTTETPVKYDVPLLGISSFGQDAKTATMHFNGDLKGLDAKVHLHRHDNMTTVRVDFDDLKKVSPTKHFVLWASTPDGYTRLGQIYNWKNRDEAKIEAHTDLKDFGLLMTVEDTDVTVPTSTTWSVFRVVP